MKAKDSRKLLMESIKRRVDEDKIIEGGWAEFSMVVVPAEAPEMQRTAMRKAFFAGAYHLFTSITNVLNGSGPTERDIARLSLIFDELQAFESVELAEYAAKQHGGPSGTA